MIREQLSTTEIHALLARTKKVAVVGLSPKSDRTSYQIAAFLQQKGVKIYPVNPQVAGTKILGELVYATLHDLPEMVDIVDVFRRSEFLPEVASEFINAEKSQVFWAQLGLVNEDAREMLQQAGYDQVVMDRCIKIEWPQTR